MLSQEFPLPDVLRIWDSLLSDETRSDFLIDVCTAMVIVIRQEILTNDFPENMKLLQNFPPMDVHLILSKAAELPKWFRVFFTATFYIEITKMYCDNYSFV